MSRRAAFLALAPQVVGDVRVIGGGGAWGVAVVRVVSTAVCLLGLCRRVGRLGRGVDVRDAERGSVAVETDGRYLGLLVGHEEVLPRETLVVAEALQRPG